MANREYALFGAYGMKAVNVYNASLIRDTLPVPSSGEYYYSAATTVGNYALFGGGKRNGPTNVVQAYVYTEV